MSYDQYDDDRQYDLEAAVGRVKAPAIILIIVGSLNLVIAGLTSFSLISYSNLPEQERLRQLGDSWEDMKPSQRQQLEADGWTKDNFVKEVDGWVEAAAMPSLISVVGGLLILIGGIRMLQFRSYGLAMFASIVSCIPFVSMLGCCCLGQGIGIWAIVVLLNGDVKALFRDPEARYGGGRDEGYHGDRDSGDRRRDEGYYGDR